MSVFDLLTLILGLSLFLFGMNLMGETLKKSAGNRLKNFLGKFTSNRFKGFILGTLVTAIIQSSSAATVMVVGFVNSGTMMLSQAIGVIMGANVGTSVTSWITALAGIEGGGAVSSLMQWFKPSTFTPIIALIGLLLFLGKNDQRKNVGTILLGFSVLMIGMETMSDSVSALSENQAFRSLLLMFENPILGLFAGIILTAVIQSSSASIGILQSFTSTGAITFGNAVPIIMGQNIGTCITAIIASTGTNKNAKRTSVIHLLFNVFGSVIGLAIFYVTKNVVKLSVLDGSIDMWGIATVHTLFNIITVAVLLPLSKQLERLSIALVREKGNFETFNTLDERFLATPSVAIERSNETVITMGQTAIDSFIIACNSLSSYSAKDAQDIKNKEILVDEYEDKIGTYLLKISEESILESENREINMLLHMIGDFERISDHAVNILESAEEINDKKIRFSDDANAELYVLINALKEITELSFNSIKERDSDKAYAVEPLEQVIDKLCEEIKSRHIVRLQRNDCTIEQGFILTDILTNLERVADHCSNIAGCFIELSRHNALEMHNALNEYREGDENFKSKYDFYAKKYELTPKR